MVLDHVAGRADAVVVAGPAADADVLGHGDLHVVDVVAVPDRLEHACWRTAAPACSAPSPCRGSGRCGTPTARGKTSSTILLSSLRALQVVAERLLDHHPAPARRPADGQSPDRLSCWTTSPEELRRDRQVERVVAAACRARRRGPCTRLGELVEGGVVVEVAGDEADALGQLGPRPPRGTRCGRARAPSRGRSARSPGRPSRGGRSRPARTPAAAGRGWRGRRRPASASCGPGRR